MTSSTRAALSVADERQEPPGRVGEPADQPGRVGGRPRRSPRRRCPRCRWRPRRRRRAAPCRAPRPCCPRCPPRSPRPTGSGPTTSRGRGDPGQRDLVAERPRRVLRQPPARGGGEVPGPRRVAAVGDRLERRVAARVTRAAAGQPPGQPVVRQHDPVHPGGVARLAFGQPAQLRDGEGHRRHRPGARRPLGRAAELGRPAPPPAAPTSRRSTAWRAAPPRPASSSVTMPCCCAATPTASARSSRPRPAAESASHQRSGWHSVPSGWGADASATTTPSSAWTRSTLVD